MEEWAEAKVEAAAKVAMEEEVGASVATVETLVATAAVLASATDVHTCARATPCLLASDGRPRPSAGVDGTNLFFVPGGGVELYHS